MVSMLPEHTAFFVALQTGVPPYGVGDSGIAKTRRTEAFGRYIDFQYECLIASQRLPEDILGAPKVVEMNDRKGHACHVMEHAMPAWRFRLENAPRGGLLHLDELGDCQPAMQAAMLQILADGINNTLICATGNPIEVSTNGYELAIPAINRLCQINWPADFSAWQRGMKSGWESLNSDFPILDPQWQTLLPVTKALVVDFTTRNSSHFQSMPTDPSAPIAPWPSMRSWTNVATVLAGARSIDAGDEIESILIAGCVGDGAALAFRKYQASLDLPNPEDLLADPSQYKPSVRGDLAFAVLCSVVAAVLRNNTPERWLAGWEVIGKQAEKAPDIAAAVCGPLAQHKPKQNGVEMTIPKQLDKILFPILAVK